MPSATTVAPSAENPIVSFAFRLEIEGIADNAYFQEVGGMGSENEIVEMKQVSQTGQEIVRKMMGRLKWGDITLKRGIGTSLSIVEWRKMVEEGNIAGARKNISIILMDSTLTDVVRWDITNAWPSKVSTGSVQAEGNAVVMEELTITHEGIIRTT